MNILAAVLFATGVIINKSIGLKHAYLCKDMPHDTLGAIALQDKEVFSLIYRTSNTLRGILRKLMPQAMIAFSTPDPKQAGIRIYPNGKRCGTSITRSKSSITIDHIDTLSWTITYDAASKYIAFAINNERWAWNTNEQSLTYMRVKDEIGSKIYSFDGSHWVCTYQWGDKVVSRDNSLPNEYIVIAQEKHNIVKKLLAQYCKEIVI